MAILGSLPTTAEGASEWKANELASQGLDCSNEPHSLGSHLEESRQEAQVLLPLAEELQTSLKVTGMPFTCWCSSVTGCLLESAPLGSLL